MNVLFSTALGEFDFSIIENEGFMGYSYLIIFLIINFVLMINLLIAMLSSIFAEM